MFGILLLVLVSFVAGLAVAGWWRGRGARPTGAGRLPRRSSDAFDEHPRGAEGENGLAAFYAYQMASSRIHCT